MKRQLLASIIGITGLLTLAACGGGGGGGGGGGVAPKQVTKLYLFGNLSTSFNVASLTTRLTVPSFTDYSASASDSNNTSALRSGVIAASGPALASTVTGSYNTSTKVLSLSFINGPTPFLNMSASTLRNGGKGTEVGTLTTAAGTTIPTVDLAPSVGQFRPSPAKAGNLSGCVVNFAP